MKLARVKQISALLLLVMLFYSKTSAQVKPGVFYAVTGNEAKDTSWLFGTYHLINDAYLKEAPAVLKAFNKVTNTVVEIVMDSSELTDANAKALLKNRQLKNLLDGPFADSLDAELKASIGQGIEQVNVLKPMTVMLTLSMSQLMKDNQALLKKYSGQPLDAFFASQAKATGKTVTALETITQQMDMLFNSITDEEQATMLQSYLRNKEKNKALSNELIKSYFENDLQKIYSIYQQSLQASGDMDFLITKRNNDWIKQLPPLLNKQSNFIAVGALHLAGPNGLVEQLRTAGYTVIPKNLQ